MGALDEYLKKQRRLLSGEDEEGVFTPGLTAASESLPFLPGIDILNQANPGFAQSPMTPSQVEAFGRARSQVIRNRQQASSIPALQKEIQAGMEDQEPGWGMATLEGLFDGLNIGNYSQVAFVDEVLTNGLSVEAFQKAAVELDNSLPFRDRDDAQRLGYADILKKHAPGVFDESTAGVWSAAGLGFVMDVLLDPITYVPVFGWGKAAAKGVAAASGTARAVMKAGQAGVPGVDKFGEYFIPHYKAKRFGVLGADRPEVDQLMAKFGIGIDPGRATEDYLKLKREMQPAIERDTIELTDKLMPLLASLSDKEAKFLQLFMDAGAGKAGEEKLFESSVRNFLEKQGISGEKWAQPVIRRVYDDAGNLKEEIPIHSAFEDIMDKAGQFREIFEEYGQRGTDAGILSDYMIKATYVASRLPQTPQSMRNWEKLARERTLDELLPPEEAQKFMPEFIEATSKQAFQKARGFKTVLERIMAGLPTELDIRLSTTRRAIEQVKAEQSMKFSRAILENPEIARFIQDPELLKNKEFLQMFDRAGYVAVDAGTFELALRASDTMPSIGEQAMWEALGEKSMVQMVKNARNAKVMIPKPIYEDMKTAGKILNDASGKEITDAIGKAQGLWKAYALFSPGYHMRNYFSNGFNNFLAGVSNPKRYAESMALQAGGTDELPILVRHGVEALIGRRSMDDVWRVVDGKPYTGNELWTQAQQLDVVNTGVLMRDVPMNMERMLVSKFEKGFKRAQIQGMSKSAKHFETMVMEAVRSGGGKVGGDLVSEDEVHAVARIWDVRAKVWSWQTGKPVDEYFSSRLSEVRRGRAGEIDNEPGYMMQVADGTADTRRVIETDYPSPKGKNKEVFREFGYDQVALPHGLVEDNLDAIFREALDGNPTIEALSRALGAPTALNMPNKSVGTDYKGLKEIAQAQILKGGHSWYKEFGRGVVALVGKKNMAEFSGAFGILSAKTDVENNLNLAYHVMRKAREFLVDGKLDEKGFTEALRPPSDVEKAVRYAVERQDMLLKKVKTSKLMDEGEYKVADYGNIEAVEEQMHRLVKAGIVGEKDRSALFKTWNSHVKARDKATGLGLSPEARAHALRPEWREYVDVQKAKEAKANLPGISNSQIRQLVDMYKEHGFGTGQMKTNTFAMNTMVRAGEGFFPFTVNDVHMARLFGAWGKDSKEGRGWAFKFDSSSGPAADRYRYAQYITARIAKDLRVDPDEVQAALWVYAKENASDLEARFINTADEGAIEALATSEIKTLAKKNKQKVVDVVRKKSEETFSEEKAAAHIGTVKDVKQWTEEVGPVGSYPSAVEFAKHEAEKLRKVIDVESPGLGDFALDYKAKSNPTAYPLSMEFALRGAGNIMSRMNRTFVGAFAPEGSKLDQKKFLSKLYTRIGGEDGRIKELKSLGDELGFDHKLVFDADAAGQPTASVTIIGGDEGVADAVSAIIGDAFRQKSMQWFHARPFTKGELAAGTDEKSIRDLGDVIDGARFIMRREVDGMMESGFARTKEGSKEMEAFLKKAGNMGEVIVEPGGAVRVLNTSGMDGEEFIIAMNKTADEAMGGTGRYMDRQHIYHQHRKTGENVKGADGSDRSYAETVKGIRMGILGRHADPSDISGRLHSEVSKAYDETAKEIFDIEFGQRPPKGVLEGLSRGGIESTQELAQLSSKGIAKGAVKFNEEGAALIKLFEGADVSTLLHESAHIFRRDLVSTDLDIIEKWAKVEGGKWTTKSEEQFARGFEKYMREGKAPIAGLGDVFAKIRERLEAVYAVLVGSEVNVRINKDVRAVFDRMLGKGTFDVDEEQAGYINEILSMETSGVMDHLEIGRRFISKYFGQDAPQLRLNRAIGRAVENNSRLAHWLAKLGPEDVGEKFTAGDKGWNMNLDDAAASVRKYLFDYTELTDFERTRMRAFIPFYTWMRKNIPLQIESLIRDPGRYAKVPKAMNNIESITDDWQDIQEPDYYRELHAVRLPILMNSKPTYVNPNLPFQDLNNLNWKDLLASMTPFLKILGEWAPAQGHSIFLDRPIERYPGEPSEVFPGMRKKTEEQLKTIIPTFGKIQRAMKAHGRGELSSQLLSEIAGIKLMNVDSRRVTRGNTYAELQVQRDAKRRAEAMGIRIPKQRRKNKKKKKNALSKYLKQGG